jgi:biotin carboxylase
MIDAMGDKSTAKATMIKAGVPVVPGSKGLLKDLEDAQEDRASATARSSAATRRSSRNAPPRS